MRIRTRTACLVAVLFAATTCLLAQPQPGTVLWTYSVDHPIVSSPTLASDGTVYLGSTTGLYAVTNAGSTASNKWTFVAEISSSSPAVAPDGTIYLASRDGNLYAINSDGSKRWAYSAQCNEGSPAIALECVLKTLILYFNVIVQTN